MYVLPKVLNMENSWSLLGFLPKEVEVCDSCPAIWVTATLL